jgi:trk system potassium uptake protein TrkA
VKPDWLGKKLIDLNLRKKYSINVVALRRGDMVTADVDPCTPLRTDDRLIVIANTEKLRKLK